MMIIDGHAHLYADESAQKIIDKFTEFHKMNPKSGIGKGTISDLQEKMTQSSTNYTVIANFAPIKSVSRTNEWTLSICSENSNLIPLVSVIPNMPIDEVKKYFKIGAKGTKMHNGIQVFSTDDDGLKEIYKYCSENRIPVTFHCGETSRVHMNELTDIENIIPVVRKYSDIPFVLTHLAAGEPDIVERIAEFCPNVLFDISIAFSGEHCIHRIHNDIWEDDTKASEMFKK